MCKLLHSFENNIWSLYNRIAFALTKVGSRMQTFRQCEDQIMMGNGQWVSYDGISSSATNNVALLLDKQNKYLPEALTKHRCLFESNTQFARWHWLWLISLHLCIYIPYGYAQYVHRSHSYLVNFDNIQLSIFFFSSCRNPTASMLSSKAVYCIVFICSCDEPLLEYGLETYIYKYTASETEIVCVWHQLQLLCRNVKGNFAAANTRIANIHMLFDSIAKIRHFACHSFWNCRWDVVWSKDVKLNKTLFC